MKELKMSFKYNISGMSTLGGILLFLTVLLSSFTQSYAQNINSDDYLPGRIRIKLKKEVAAAGRQRIQVNPNDFKSLGLDKIDEVNKNAGITEIRRVFPFSPKFEAKHRKYGLDQWYELKFDPEIDPSIIVEKYKGLSDIEIAKPVIKKVSLENNNRVVVFKKPTSSSAAGLAAFEEDSVVFNDPLLVDQWHYDNDGRFGPGSFDIDLLSAWQNNTGNSDIIVSIVDQGVDVFHEDLAANMWQNEAEINGEEGVDDDGNGYIDDFHGWNFIMRGAVSPGSHGTHVAGTVGAVSNNGVGVAGVAGGDGSGNGVKLMTCQVFDDRMNSGQNFAEAIVYSADNGAVISQNSWNYNQPDFYEPEVLDAINYFINEAGQYEGSPMKGGILFFSAGNSGSEQNKYPGAFDNVVGVTAVGPTGFPTGYSTYGEWTDIAAPGGDMINFGEEGGVLSTLPGNSYGYMEGTSMACPHVSGVAALVISKFGGPDFTAEDLKRIILNSTARFNFAHDNLYGQGYLNAQRALIDDNRIPPNAVDDLRASQIFHNEIRLAWTVPDDPDGNDPAFYYFVFRDEPISDSNFDNDAVYLIENSLASGETFELRLTGLLKNKEYWIALKTVDQFENVSDISNVLNVVTSDEPHFMESTRSIDITLDAQNNLVEKIPLTFSNIGEGIVYWTSTVSNEEYFFGPSSQDFNASIAVPSEVNELIEQDSTVSPEASFQAVSQELLDANGFEIRGEHWENDVTEYVAGLSYENGTFPASLAGARNSNAGFIMATRFDVPRDYSFNLTHIEAVLLPNVKEYPIKIEIKKGGRNDFSQAETVYMQEYYPDTVDILNYYRIPIYRPQRFEDGETFWVVMNFPKEMTYPLALQLSDQIIWEHFLISFDNGRSYQELINYALRPFIPMISAYSTGNDGSYVFLDPTFGEIPQANANNVEVTIDANSLTNGEHLASLGIITNDIHKPVVNIEVKVNVINQPPQVEDTGLQEFVAFYNRENSLTLSLKNSGLGDLIITGLSSPDTAVSENLSLNVQIAPDAEGDVPFVYHPAVTGVIQSSVILTTNIGDITLPVQITSQEEPLAEISLDNSNISVQSGSVAEVSMKIKNTGTGAPLEYDLTNYSNISTSAGVLPIKLSYVISSSSDTGGPQPNQWEDISGFGTRLVGRDIQSDVPLEMKFPYFNQLLENMYVSGFGRLIPFNDGYIVPLRIAGKGISIEELFYHNFGDRSVFTFSTNVTSFSGTGNDVIGNLVYQVVLFRSGAIEFRYKDVDYLKNGDDYTIWLDGIEFPEKILYRDFGDTTKSVENGTVIRFAPEREVSQVKYAQSLSGNIVSGDSATVQFVIDPTYFEKYAGQHQNEIIIQTNTFDKSDTVRFQVDVSGLGSIDVQDSLEFASTTLGQLATGFIRVDNHGTDSVRLVSAISNLSDLQPVFLSPVGISARSNYYLPVNLIPSSSGLINGIVTLTFENGAVLDVPVTGAGEPDRSYVHTVPDNLSFNLAAGESSSVNFSVTNTTSGLDLDYIFRNSVFASVSPETAVQDNDSLNSFNYDYTWAVSDSLAIFHKWYDISAQSELLQIEAAQQELLVLPFKLPFFNQEFDSIWISRNGYVTVVEPEGEPEQTFQFETGDGLRGMIAPFWSGLKPSSTNGVWVKIETDRVFIQWSDFVGSDLMTSSGKVTFQLELVEDGSIYFHYRDISSWGGLIKYGLESPNELEILEDPRAIIVNYAEFKDNSTISINKPERGILSSQEMRNFNIKVSAENIFYPGVYMDTVVLETNSSSQQYLSIPVELNVTGAPVLTTLDTINWGEVVFREGLEIKETFKIVNEGHDVLSVDNIAGQNIPDFELYLSNGDRIVRNGSGDLLNPLTIEPWGSETIEVLITIPEQKNLNGVLELSGNFVSTSLALVAEVVESPVFSWNAVDQDLSVINNNDVTYSFSIENQGVSTLKYTLIPAVIPDISDVDTTSVVSEIGNYTFDKPTTVDSLALDQNEVGDGVFTPFAVGANLSFANRFTAPAGGLYITHIKTYNYLVAIGEYVRIKIYTGGEMPEEGELVYDQNFLIDAVVDQEWIYFELEKPFVIPEGQTFFVAVAPPVAQRYIGFDVSTDVNVLQNCFSGVYQGDDRFYWYPGYTQGEQMVWKIRPITAAGKAQWLELDQLSGELQPGESAEIQARVIAENLESGIYKAKVQASSNDINRFNDEFNIQVSVNAAPVFDYYPNMYEDTLRVFEDDQRVFNYLFTDPENEAVEIVMDSSAVGPEVNFTQLSNSTAQLSVTTGYEDAGVYQYSFRMSDEAGNQVTDTLLIEVVDKNRPPVLNQDYATIYFNLADTMQSLVINPNDLFSDPDGDDFQVLAGNYNPEIVDLTFGDRFLSLIPITEGTAQVIFAADDGKENGFVAYLVFVVIIDDPSAVVTGVGDQGELADGKKSDQISLYPNPVSGSNATLSYSLNSPSDVTIQVTDMQGRVVLSVEKIDQIAADHKEYLNLKGLPKGLFTCAIWVDGTFKGALKMVIR